MTLPRQPINMEHLATSRICVAQSIIVPCFIVIDIFMLFVHIGWTYKSILTFSHWRSLEHIINSKMKFCKIDCLCIFINTKLEDSLSLSLLHLLCLSCIQHIEGIVAFIAPNSVARATNQTRNTQEVSRIYVAQNIVFTCFKVQTFSHYFMALNERASPRVPNPCTLKVIPPT